MKRLLLAAGCAGISLAALAGVEKTSEFVAMGMSPDGQKVVGYHDRYDNSGLYSSALWQPGKQQLDWITTFKQNDLGLCGGFTCVNDLGMYAGYIKDPESATFYDEWMGEDVTVNFRCGAIWRDDKTYVLPSGGFSWQDYSDENDGGYVHAISADGLKATGNIIVAWMEMFGCVWTYNADEDEYDFELLEMPEGAKRALAYGMSTDGKVIVGTVNVSYGELNIEIPCIWEEGKSPVVLSPEKMSGSVSCNFICVSPNGRYVAFGYGPSNMTLYDMESSELRTVEVPEAYSSVGVGGVDDYGNIVGQAIMKEGRVYKSIYYSNRDNVLAPFEHVISNLGEPLELPADVQSAYLSAVSADGNSFLAISTVGTQQTAYWVNAPINAVRLYSTVTGFEAMTTSPSSVMLRWIPIPNFDNILSDTTTGYGIYVNGEKIDCVTGDLTDNYIIPDLEEGYYDFAVSAIYGGDESAPCEAIRLFVNADTFLPYYDDFEGESLDMTQWSYDAEGTNGELMTWGTITGDDYENMTGHLQSFSISTEPYRNTLVSRWFDASDLDHVYLMAYVKLQLLNYADQDLRHDWLDFDYTTDGINWENLTSLRASDITLGTWDFIDEEISDKVAGKLFKIRLNSYGDGTAMIKWMVDMIKVGTKEEKAAPTQVRAFDNNGVAEIVWPSSAGSYEASYVLNSNLLTDYNLGDEGKPFIAAISLDNEQLSNFHGMYMRGVTAFIFDDPSLAADPTDVEVMVWEDNVLVSSNEVDLVFYDPVSSFMPLEKPVKIDASKEYKVGVKLITHDPKQAPIYYQAAEAFCLPGRSDLYSEDDGATWHRVYDDLQDSPRFCIWSIRANITAEADTEMSDAVDGNLLGFNVYRADGSDSTPVKLNDGVIYSAAPRYYDADASAESRYFVTAYYANGHKSALSEPAKLEAAAIDNVIADDFTYAMEDGKIVFGNGDIKALVVRDMAGRIIRIASGNSVNIDELPSGVYIITAECADKNISVKVLF